MLDLLCLVLILNMILWSIYFVAVLLISFYSFWICALHYSFWAQLHAFKRDLNFPKEGWSCLASMFLSQMRVGNLSWRIQLSNSCSSGSSNWGLSSSLKGAKSHPLSWSPSQSTARQVTYNSRSPRVGLPARSSSSGPVNSSFPPWKCQDGD